MLSTHESDVADELRADAEIKTALIKRKYGNEAALEFEKTCEEEIGDLLKAFWYVEDEYSWTHVTFSKAGNEFDNFSVGQEFNVIADKYFSSSPVRSKSLDWFLVDALIASAYAKLHRGYERDVFPKSFSLKTVRRSLMYWLAAWYSLVWLTKWAVLISAVILFAVLGIDHPAAFGVSISIVVLIVYFRERKRRLMKPLVMDYGKKMLLVQRVYELTSTPNINWDVLKSELEETRKQGIAWHSALYSAIKYRIEAPEATQPLILRKKHSSSQCLLHNEL